MSPRAPRRTPAKRAPAKRTGALGVHQVASAAKLDWATVKRIRARRGYTREHAQADADALDVCIETVWRAYVGRTWRVQMHRRLPDEYKRCVACGKLFGRRFHSGRYRNPDHWAQKSTCDKSCHNRARTVVKKRRAT